MSCSNFCPKLCGRLPLVGSHPSCISMADHQHCGIAGAGLVAGMVGLEQSKGSMKSRGTWGFVAKGSVSCRGCRGTERVAATLISTCKHTSWQFLLALSVCAHVVIADCSGNQQSCY